MHRSIPGKVKRSPGKSEGMGCQGLQGGVHTLKSEHLSWISHGTLQGWMGPMTRPVPPRGLHHSEGMIGVWVTLQRAVSSQLWAVSQVISDLPSVPAAEPVETGLTIWCARASGKVCSRLYTWVQLIDTSQLHTNS